MYQPVKFLSRGAMGIVVGSAMTLLASAQGKAAVLGPFDVFTPPANPINIYGANGGTLNFDLEVLPGFDGPFGSVNFKVTSNNPSLSGFLGGIELLGPALPGASSPLYGDVTGGTADGSMFDSTFWSVTVAPTDLGGSPIQVSIDTTALHCIPGYCADPNLTITSTGDLSFTAPNAGVPGPVAGAGIPGIVFAVSGLLTWMRRRRSGMALA